MWSDLACALCDMDARESKGRRSGGPIVYRFPPCTHPLSQSSYTHITFCNSTLNTFKIFHYTVFITIFTSQISTCLTPCRLLVMILIKSVAKLIHTPPTGAKVWATRPRRSSLPILRNLCLTRPKRLPPTLLIPSRRRPKMPVCITCCLHPTAARECHMRNTADRPTQLDRTSLLLSKLPMLPAARPISL